MAEEENDVPYNVADAAAAVVQDLLVYYPQNHGNVDKFLLEAPDKTFLMMKVNYNSIR
jgi:hypothetical protein